VVPTKGEGTRHRERQMEGGGLQNVVSPNAEGA
jgi:hypothetical protein